MKKIKNIILICLVLFGLHIVSEYHISKVEGYGANYEMHIILTSNPKVDKLTFTTYNEVI